MISQLPFYPHAMERAAAALETHPSYRILRAVPPIDLFPITAPQGPIRTALVLDTETTGLDPRVDKIVELAALEVRFDGRGRVVGYGRMRDWLGDPGAPLSAEISRLTRLTDADLAGRTIDESEATEMIGSADMIVAHNVRFDVEFVEKRFPVVAGKNWACSMAEIDWPSFGYDGRKLGHILMQRGFFHGSHRADADVLALTWLLAHEIEPGRTGLRALIDVASEPTVRVAAVGAPILVKNALKARHYRWDGVRRWWAIEVPPTALDAELAWLRTEAQCENPKVREITWFERHR